MRALMSGAHFIGMFSNMWLWVAIVLSLVLQVAVIYVPISAAGVFDGKKPERRRLAALRRRGELGAVAPRAEQACGARVIGTTANDLWLINHGETEGSLLAVADHCLRSRNDVNVIVAGKQPGLQYLDMMPPSLSDNLIWVTIR